MIDPVELKARLVQMDSDPIPAERQYAEAVIRGRAIVLARQVLALSDEVERLNETIDALRRDGTKMMCSYETAESEAQALRERMGEINKLASAEERFDPHSLRTAGLQWADALERIAALSTTPKEKEG